MHRILKIAVTGPESTGKSMLAEQLAGHYKTVWVPEYAREYINSLGRPYEQADILEIARGQVRSEEQLYGKAQRVMFCDTELIVTKIWSEVKYSHCDPLILQMMSEREYDLYLLCDVDLPWVDDPQREHPHLRAYLFGLYEKELNERHANYAVVSGIGRSRLENAIKIIEKSFPEL